ncbi:MULTISPECIES: hypothetical protein [unclassified Streptomyces]|uniref:hypothetical protein n=1 Tax=unclassified Streptomyces TaxID=2593676 RepID=UPI0036C36817
MTALPTLTLTEDADPTWWKAPLFATLPGLPLMVGLFALFATEGGLTPLLVLAPTLLTASWLLPHHRRYRLTRTTTAALSLALALLPFAMGLLMAMATASG